MWKPVLTASIVAVSLAGPVAAKSNGCPPGLAKKAVPCVPRDRRRNIRGMTTIAMTGIAAVT